MARVTDQDHDATLPDITLALAMDLGDERTRRIENAQTTCLRILLHEPRDAMRAENGDRSGGHFRKVLDETCAFCAQALGDMAVVNDFVRTYTGAPNFASACSTMSMARITPAQKPRGWASITRTAAAFLASRTKRSSGSSNEPAIALRCRSSGQ